MSYWYLAGAKRSAALSFFHMQLLTGLFVFLLSFSYLPHLSIIPPFLFITVVFLLLQLSFSPPLASVFFSSCLSLSSTSLCIVIWLTCPLFCRSLPHFYMHVRLLLEEVVFRVSGPLAALQAQTFWPHSCSGFAAKPQKSSWQF